MKLWTALAHSEDTAAHIPNKARITFGEAFELGHARYYVLETGEIIEGSYLSLLKLLRDDGNGASLLTWVPGKGA